MRGLITSLEESIIKYGFNNYLHHQNELLPSLIKQVSAIPRDSLGSYNIPEHAEEKYQDAKIKPIVWTSIYTDVEDSYSITLFRLFKNSKMPLHDHPDISGINYLLSGSVEQQTYDIIDVLNSDKRQFVGIKYQPTNLEENDVMITFPHKQNLHEFIAKENTAILQVLFPAYDHKIRVCSYFEVNNNLSDQIKHKHLVDIEKNKTIDINNLSINDIVGLNIIPEPQDKVDVNVPYDGLFE